MPKVTIWIREEDMEAWEKIPDRPEWIHDHLNSFQQSEYFPQPKSSPLVCRNGHPFAPGRDRCTAKGCKYSAYS